MSVFTGGESRRISEREEGERERERARVSGKTMYEAHGRADSGMIRLKTLCMDNCCWFFVHVVGVLFVFKAPPSSVFGAVITSLYAKFTMTTTKSTTM